MKDKIYLIILFLVCFVIGCGAGTTQTTNPTGGDGSYAPNDGVFDGSGEENVASEDDAGGDDEASGTTGETTEENETSRVLGALCDAVSACYSNADTDACVTSLNKDDNALFRFGADIDEYASFDDVQDAIDDNELVVDASEIRACIDAIEEVTCSDMVSDSVYSNSNSLDYSRVYYVIPVEC